MKLSNLLLVGVLCLFIFCKISNPKTFKAVKVSEYKVCQDNGPMTYLYWMMLNDNSYGYYQSSTPVSDFSKVSFKETKTMPEEIQNEKPDKELEVNEKEISGIEENEMVEETVPETSSSTETSTESSSSGGESSGGESAGDGGDAGGGGE
jgi:uncharacterized membrane protein YgcG